MGFGLQKVKARVWTIIVTRKDTGKNQAMPQSADVNFLETGAGYRKGRQMEMNQSRAITSRMKELTDPK